jgi:valyl-tRNA synthetase
MLIFSKFMPITLEEVFMSVTLPSLNGGNSPISADLLYRFYDNKAITPSIRAALQKREDEEAKNSSESSSSKASKFGPATRVDITDQIVRMNMSKNSAKTEKEETASKSKTRRYDVLAEVKKSVAEREAAAKAEKDAALKEIADKVAATEQ